MRAQPLFAKKQAVAAPLLDKNGKEFWQGDWVCAGKKTYIATDFENNM